MLVGLKAEMLETSMLPRRLKSKITSMPTSMSKVGLIPPLICLDGPNVICNVAPWHRRRYGAPSPLAS